MGKIIKNVYKIIGLAILIISLSVSLTLYKKNKDFINKNSSVNVGIVEGMDGLEDLFEDDDSQTQDETQNNNQTQQTVKKYTNGFNCFKDSIQKINNSIGFKAVTTSTGQVTVLGITETQYIKETFILSGDYYLKEQQGYCTSSLGKFFYRYSYSNNNAQSIRHKETSKLTSNSLEANPDWSQTTIDTTLSLEQLYNYDPYAYNIFTILPTKKSEIVGSFDPTEDKNYYIIRFKLDLNSIPSDFAENIKKEGDLEDIKLTALERTYYIEKSTLNIRKIERIDTYNMKKGIANGSFVFTAQTLFVGVDKVYTPSEPNK